jgi:type IV secretory pathway VirD2 relaxase
VAGALIWFNGLSKRETAETGTSVSGWASVNILDGNSTVQVWDAYLGMVNHLSGSPPSKGSLAYKNDNDEFLWHPLAI